MVRYLGDKLNPRESDQTSQIRPQIDWCGALLVGEYPFHANDREV
jgi:hypothetical protein